MKKVTLILFEVENVIYPFVWLDSWIRGGRVKVCLVKNKGLFYEPSKFHWIKNIEFKGVDNFKHSPKCYCAKRTFFKYSSDKCYLVVERNKERKQIIVIILINFDELVI